MYAKLCQGRERVCGGKNERQGTQHFVGSWADVLRENDGELGEDVGHGE